MKLSLGFSPCPNDTFIFDAMVNGLMDTQGLTFDLHLEDVQTLNEWAIAGKLDITKVSYGVWPLLQNEYSILDAGSALGKGVGPLMVSLPGIENFDAANMSIAIPGENTTAHLLFKQAFPHAKHKVFLRYDQIEEAVLNKQVDAGVIIHENRFTYAAKGLQLLFDLGAYWEGENHCPIPLGGIVGKKNLNAALLTKVEMLIKQSVEYSFKQLPNLSAFIQTNAQEMSVDVMRQHIDLYVNEYSLSLGEVGRKAIGKLMGE
jgi:1,4-dihydroxy-6-naphthoate synthase